jgi:hypothetical protein
VALSHSGPWILLVKIGGFENKWKAIQALDRWFDRFFKDHPRFRQFEIFSLCSENFGTAPSKKGLSAQMIDWIRADNLKEAVAFTTAAAAGIFALWRWRVDQNWRRIQYARTLIKEFFEDASVTKACEVLDTVDEKIIFEDESDPKERRVIMITDAFLIGAFSTLCQKPKNTDDEQHVRHVFDKFFDGISMLQSHIDTGLIKLKDVTPYLEYWVIEMCGFGKIHDDVVAHQIRRYLECFGYKQVLTLVSNMRHPIKECAEPSSLPYRCYCKSGQKRSSEAGKLSHTPT